MSYNQPNLSLVASRAKSGETNRSKEETNKGGIYKKRERKMEGDKEKMEAKIRKRRIFKEALAQNVFT